MAAQTHRVAEQEFQAGRPRFGGPNPFGGLEIGLSRGDLAIFDWNLLVFGYMKSVEGSKTQNPYEDAKNELIF